LLHAVSRSSSDVPRHLYGYGITESQDPAMRDAQRRLQLAIPVKRQTSAAIDARVLLGNTTTEISRTVNSIGADLLVVSVPKRGVISRALFGTTAARLLREVRIPMLAVPDVGKTGTDQGSTSLQFAA
jgi:nucleotide-binding universal stress UspA family protein